MDLGQNKGQTCVHWNGRKFDTISKFAKKRENLQLQCYKMGQKKIFFFVLIKNMKNSEKPFHFFAVVQNDSIYLRFLFFESKVWVDGYIFVSKIDY